jgi:hypothetical protein
MFLILHTSFVIACRVSGSDFVALFTSPSFSASNSRTAFITDSHYPLDAPPIYNSDIANPFVFASFSARFIASIEYITLPALFAVP